MSISTRKDLAFERRTLLSELLDLFAREDRLLDETVVAHEGLRSSRALRERRVDELPGVDDVLDVFGERLEARPAPRERSVQSSWNGAELESLPFVAEIALGLHSRVKVERHRHSICRARRLSGACEAPNSKNAPRSSKVGGTLTNEIPELAVDALRRVVIERELLRPRNDIAEGARRSESCRSPSRPKQSVSSLPPRAEGLTSCQRLGLLANRRRPPKESRFVVDRVE